MQEDLAYCVKEFSSLMRFIDEDIQDGQLKTETITEKITTVELFMGLMLKIIKQTMIEALRDQEEGGESQCKRI
ncbi:MAG: hypothetical protein E6276_06160 [Clostridiales bacterium]|nr:hypothetical protein [Clostridiales bacterium]